jgi:hypothetical protein
MTERHILCDECFLNYGISATPMAKTGPLSVTAPGAEFPLGDSYQCPCGRYYSSIHGYFTLIKGSGVSRMRSHPRCASEDLRPLYLTQGLSRGRGKFVCPECGKEREEEVSGIPSGA